MKYYFFESDGMKIPVAEKESGKVYLPEIAWKSGAMKWLEEYADDSDNFDLPVFVLNEAAGVLEITINQHLLVEPGEGNCDETLEIGGRKFGILRDSWTEAYKLEKDEGGRLLLEELRKEVGKRASDSSLPWATEKGGVLLSDDGESREYCFCGFTVKLSRDGLVTMVEPRV